MGAVSIRSAIRRAWQTEQQWNDLALWPTGTIRMSFSNTHRLPHSDRLNNGPDSRCFWISAEQILDLRRDGALSDCTPAGRRSKKRLWAASGQANNSERS